MEIVLELPDGVSVQNVKNHVTLLKKKMNKSELKEIRETIAYLGTMVKMGVKMTPSIEVRVKKSIDIIQSYEQS